MKTSFARFRIPFLLAVGLLVSMQAAAGIRMDRDVTITDEAGGTLTLVTSATHDVIGSASLTTASFAQFQPRADGRRVDGEVVRNRFREAERVVTTFDGALEIRVPPRGSAPAVLNTLVFGELTVTRRGAGPVLSGTVIYNGEEIDAGALPARAAALLERALRFFHFA